MSIISIIGEDQLSTIDYNKYRVSPLPPRNLNDNNEKTFMVTLLSTSERKKLALEKEKTKPFHSLSTTEKYIHLYIVNTIDSEEIPDELEEVIERIVNSNKSFSTRESELIRTTTMILSKYEVFELLVCFRLKNFVL